MNTHRIAYNVLYLVVLLIREHAKTHRNTLTLLSIYTHFHSHFWHIPKNDKLTHAIQYIHAYTQTNIEPTFDAQSTYIPNK